MTKLQLEPVNDGAKLLIDNKHVVHTKEGVYVILEYEELIELSEVAEAARADAASRSWVDDNY